ncbi:MAG: hypothetical protein QGH37_12315 [Candidatus Poribacteria bacterium]|jgi:hypothetical protein|nr:hypothetical protein [Candidatus Poribacteria bacterium]MDP6997730.1 hypothetical protein [Candidatus Poribacteria bacterium]
MIMVCLSALALALMHFNSVSPVSGQATNTFATMDVLSALAIMVSTRNRRLIRGLQSDPQDGNPGVVTDFTAQN